jgi:hypothetical protein
MKKATDTKRIGGYIVASDPRKTPPEGLGPVHAELARWYLAGPGAWTSDREKAVKFADAVGALRAIKDLRDRVMGVEFTLVPAYGMTFTRALPG